MKLSLSSLEEKSLNNVTRSLTRFGMACWQGDDSGEAYAVLEKVQRLVYNGGGRCIRIESSRVTDTKIGELSSGKFLAFYE